MPGRPGALAPSAVVRYAAFDAVTEYVPGRRLANPNRPWSSVMVLRFVGSAGPVSVTIARRIGCPVGSPVTTTPASEAPASCAAVAAIAGRQQIIATRMVPGLMALPQSRGPD